jgi:hypothetical protein
VRPSISHGTPSDGKSVGSRLRMLPTVAFIDALAAFTCASRAAGSARCVPRLIRLIEACVLAVASPALRSEIGTAATSDLRGSGP